MHQRTGEHTAQASLAFLYVHKEVAVGGWLYSAGPAAPAILYFHGNGEVAADYNEIATLYTQLGITLRPWEEALRAYFEERDHAGHR